MPVSGSLAPVGQANLFQLQGQAGQILYFKTQAETGGTAGWALFDPNGQRAVQAELLRCRPVQADRFTGTYYVLVYDQNQDYTPPLTYAFNVFDNTPSAPVAILPANNTPAPDLLVQAPRRLRPRRHRAVRLGADRVVAGRQWRHPAGRRGCGPICS